jgi:hypothetical protein
VLEGLDLAEHERPKGMGLDRDIVKSAVVADVAPSPHSIVHVTCVYTARV